MNSLIVRSLAVIALAFCMNGCDVDVEDKGEMPDVDVDVQGGRAPEVEVTPPKVDVGTKETDVTVPDIDVDTEEKTITVPDIDVDVPDEEDNEPTTPQNPGG